MAYERLDKRYTAGQVWDEAAISHIDDSFETLFNKDGTVTETTTLYLPSNSWLSEYSYTTEFTQDFIFLDTSCLLPAEYDFLSIDIVTKKAGEMRVYFLNSENFSIETYATIEVPAVGSNTVDMKKFSYDNTKSYYIAVAGLTDGGSLAADYSNTSAINGYRFNLDGTEKTARNYPLGYMIHAQKTTVYDNFTKLKKDMGDLDDLLVYNSGNLVEAINEVVSLTCNVETVSIDLPSNDWFTHHSFTTEFTQDFIFLDTSCLLPANYKFSSIDINATQGGAMRVYFLNSSNFAIETYAPINVVKGMNNIDMTTFTYDKTKDYYIAVAGLTNGGALSADYSNASAITGWRWTLDGSDKTSRNYALGYAIHASSTTLSKDDPSGDNVASSTDIGDLDNLITNDKSNLVASINEIASEIAGDTLYTVLPAETWMTDYSYTTEFTQGYIFGDTRCILSPNDTLVSIDIAAKAAGTMSVYLLNTSFGIVTSQSVTVSAGINYGIDLSSLDYDKSKSYYVAVCGDTTALLTKYTVTGSYGYRLDKDGSNKVARNYPLGYAIHTSSQIDSLKDRVEELETNSLQIVTTVSELEAAVLNGGYIFVNPGTYEITTPLALKSGTRIEGARGASIIQVPSSVLIGFDLRNVEDVVIQNLTIRGAYNGTPLKSGMQPVAPGIVDTVDDAYALSGIGYQTDLTNLCVTDTYVPQVGINVNTCEKCEILGCEITKFSYAGIMNRLSGKNYRYAMKVNNNYINDCYIGIWVYDEAERTQYIANNVALCQIGFYMDSGTNLLNACSFTANRIGMMMGHGWNHAHGEVTDCAFTHCGLFGLLAKNIQHGQTFNGGKFGYADPEEGNGGGYAVWVENSMGIVLQNLKLINCNSCFTGRLTTTYSKNSTENDVFGNSHYTYTENTVTSQGAHRVFNCSSTGGSFLISDDAVVRRKENFYLSGADSSALNDT